MYPEWIQEQLDKLPHQPQAAEARLLRYLAARFDRIDAKLDRIGLALDRLLALCESE